MAFKKHTPVTVGSEWRHSGGKVYTVLHVANTRATNPDLYPISVVYIGANKEACCRPLLGWSQSMIWIKNIDKLP